MNTPTHLLISSALLSRPGDKPRNWAVIAGALVPDAYLYGLFLWSKAVALPERELWGRVYWEPSVQFWSALSNSIPLYLALLVTGLVITGRHKWVSAILVIFSLSALLHMAFDFPFHNSDAHRHFSPISDWRFHSPLSYWNEAFYGRWVGLFELGLALGLILVLWRRFKSRLVRGMLTLGAMSYIAVPLYFTLALG